MKVSSFAPSFITALFLHLLLPAVAKKKPVNINNNINNDDFFSQIVGGEEADPGEFKFMASWHGSFNVRPSCGGSLVAPNLILSAAHCAGIPGNIRVGSIRANSVYNGDPPGVEVIADQQIMHPEYEFPDYDYMLLVLSEAVNTSDYPPIDLNFDASEPRDGDELTVIGFGRISSGGGQPNNLLKVDVPTVSHDTCSSQYNGIREDLHLCAGYEKGGKDSCQGDSGGPIFKEIDGVLKQVGIVSFGRGCAEPNASGVYARVSGVGDWLKKEICERSEAPRPSYCAPLTPNPTIECNQSRMTIEVTTDNYPEETSWTLSDTCNNDEELASRNNFFGTETHVNEVCVTSSKFNFTINDSYGDGICCSYGKGSYKVTYKEDVFEGSNFGTDASHTFGSCEPPPTAPSNSPSILPTNVPSMKPSVTLSISPSSSPSPTIEGSFSCIAGDTGILSKGKNEIVESITLVRDLKIGDYVHGVDKKKKSTTCKIEAIGSFGTGPVYGNYTDDHFVYNETSKKVQVHGETGPYREVDKYDLITDCPLVEDESGTKFGPMDSDFCGARREKIGWKKYLLLHKAILNVVRKSGTFWFQESSYQDMKTLRKFAPKVCRNMIKCMKNNRKCKGLEKASEELVNNVLTKSAKVQAKKAFTNFGSSCLTGSVSAVITGGKSVDESLIGTANC
mmetsp:Transcript_5042/g.5848  ORF Transcript_5042/g.5848 Transcript_5042/m.5848 type:complete len:677 (-) Transcript_5042:124-2154(-)